MTQMFYDSSGIRRPISVLNAATRLEKLKKENGSDPWPVIAECYRIWANTHPNKYESYLFYLNDIKQTRKVTQVGRGFFSGVSRAQNGQLTSYVADMPKQVMYMIRAVYNSEELPMNKEFWEEFINRFPKQAIREKL